MNELIVEVERVQRHHLVKGICTCNGWPHTNTVEQRVTFEQHRDLAQSRERMAEIVKENYLWAVAIGIMSLPALAVLPWGSRGLGLTIAATMLSVLSEWFLFTQMTHHVNALRRRMKSAQVLANTSGYWLLSVFGEIMGIGAREDDTITFDIFANGQPAFFRGIWSNLEEPTPLVITNHQSPIHLLADDRLTYTEPAEDWQPISV